jgi:hypothetical protein
VAVPERRLQRTREAYPSPASDVTAALVAILARTTETRVGRLRQWHVGLGDRVEFVQAHRHNVIRIVHVDPLQITEP